MRRALAGLVLCALPFALGCVGILVPTFSRRDPSLDAARWLSEQEGAVARADVLLRLGEPHFAGDEEGLLAYRWHDTRALGFLCAGGYYAADCVGLSIGREFDLLLRFDAAGKLTGSEIATGLELGEGSGTACSASGLCVSGVAARAGSEPIAAVPLADEERADDRSHLVFERGLVPADERWAPAGGSRCALVVLPASPGIASIFVDARLAGLASRDGWLGVALAPGAHRVAVVDPLGTAELPATANALELACDAGERVVVAQERAGLVGTRGGALEVVASLTPEQRAGRERRYLSTWRAMASGE